MKILYKAPGEALRSMVIPNELGVMQQLVDGYIEPITTKGVPKSEETRERIKKNHAHLSGENSPNSKTVLCVETGEIFHGAVTAARKIGIYPSGITRCCQGIKKTAGGYHWRYMDD